MKIKLCHLGQFYSAVNSEKNPGTYSVGVHLKEPLKPKVLQQAANDLIKRLPHMNVRGHSGFFHYYNVASGKPLKIEKINARTQPCRHFKKGSQLLRILYGRRHFTLEVLHSVCDGRSLAMAASSLLIRYYELMELKADKSGFVDCAAAPDKEEAEDAYLSHADMRKSKSKKTENVYIPKFQPAKHRIITHKFEIAELKPRAKAHGITLTEYIMAGIFTEYAKLRAKEDVEKPITCSIPIDCRGFFPTKSLRNFVTHKIVKMPETTDFAKMVAGIKKQFETITPDFVQEKISEMERLIRLGRFVPLFIKKWAIKGVGHSATAGCSTAFSNLGLIKLPAKIQDKVDMYTFALGPEPDVPHLFACVATGGTLTLTITTSAKDISIMERIGKNLKEVQAYGA
ncbi:MAG: hypothetical protein FWB74_09250 [Defluviitaleaceae bacterium]|nr:hypothetical protein [Defluviitaleaceae bacterium]